MRTIRDYNLKDKKVIIRCDFNVPIKEGIITDDNRIRESLKTIEFAINANAKVILMSHLGKVKTEQDKSANSLEPVAKSLSKYLNKKVIFVDETRGEKPEKAINNMENGDIVLIQNTRYEDIEDRKESTNNDELGKYWASLGDIFINDAFGTAHRSHASNVGIATYLPNGIGFLIEKELEILVPAIDNPKRPFTVILGGSKVSDKLAVIKNLVNIADYVLIGGGMANTFLSSIGINVGSSKTETSNEQPGEEYINYIGFCKDMFENNKNKILLPTDVVVNNVFEDTKGEIKDIKNVEKDDLILDVGPKTIETFEKIISESNQVIWNGPMGVFEFDNYSKGTKRICEILSKNNGITIIGGGDSAAAAIKFGYKDSFTHISTGGGASLELLEGKNLPGIEIIERMD